MALTAQNPTGACLLWRMAVLWQLDTLLARSLGISTKRVAQKTFQKRAQKPLKRPQKPSKRLQILKLGQSVSGICICSNIRRCSCKSGVLRTNSRSGSRDGLFSPGHLRHLRQSFVYFSVIGPSAGVHYSRQGCEGTDLQGWVE